jgi:hypothetical protein
MSVYQYSAFSIFKFGSTLVGKRIGHEIKAIPQPSVEKFGIIKKPLTKIIEIPAADN